MTKCLIPVLSIPVVVTAVWAVPPVRADLTLTRGGKSDCTIVVGHATSEQERYAAEELARFLKEMSGAAIPIKTDRDDVKGLVVYVGRNEWLEGTGARIAFDQLGREGFVIRTLRGALLIAGGQPRGTLYGVYSFLEDELGCRWFTPDCSRIPQRPSITVRSLDRTVVPPLEYRATDYPNARDADWAVRNKINGTQARLDAKRGGKIAYSHFVHTFNSILSPDQYFASHPEYFSEINGRRRGGRTQLCLTNPEVQRIAIETVKRWIAEAPDATIFSVSQNDWHNYCTCANCRAVAEREGSQSGPLLAFVNKVAESICAEHPDKLISTLAYQYTRKPPKTLRPAENVTVRLCSIECCFAHPLTTPGDPENEKFVADVRQWANICDRLYIWDYVINYSHAIMPFPNLYSLQPNIRFFVANHVKGIYEEACYFTKGGEFSELRTWIIAKTLWNPNYDTERAIAEFLAGYYGAAAGPLREYIRMMHENVKRGNHHFTIRTPPTTPAFSPAVIDRSVALFDKAEAAVQKDPKLLHRVQVARLPIVYVQIAQGLDKLKKKVKGGPSKAQINRWLDRFERVARKEGITHVREHEQGRLDRWLKRMRAACKGGQ